MQNLKNIDIQDILLNHEQIDEISTLVKPCVYDKVVHSWFKNILINRLKKAFHIVSREEIVKEINKYLQKMIATSNLMDSGEEKKTNHPKKEKTTN